MHAIPVVLVWSPYQAQARGHVLHEAPLVEVRVDTQATVPAEALQPILTAVTGKPAHGPTVGPVMDGTLAGGVEHETPAAAIPQPIKLPGLGSEAAQAGPSMAVDDEPEPERSVVRGSGKAHAGGVTQVGAASIAPVYEAEARAGGDTGESGAGTGAGGGGGASDLTRRAGLGGDRHWQCADAFTGSNANLRGLVVVHARADVRPDGTPGKVVIVEAPTQSFANAAARCALKERFDPALDARGTPVRGWTDRFRVVFSKY